MIIPDSSVTSFRMTLCLSSRPECIAGALSGEILCGDAVISTGAGEAGEAERSQAPLESLV